jgi:pimeloyl-ACP methyl ester carboxylesterase
MASTVPDSDCDDIDSARQPWPGLRLVLKADSVASFVPAGPVRVLVLAHGFPWPDDSRSEDELAEYARAAVKRWRAFAEKSQAILVAPRFGGRDFGRYREMAGRETDPDEFVNRLVDEVTREYIPGASGRFSLHGHSAGAQFAARYLVTHPGRLRNVVLSAPSTYPFPDPAVSWPYGMGSAARLRAGGTMFTPRPEGWRAATTEVAVDVLVGARDTESRPTGPGQPGSTRIERAFAWVDSMHRLAAASGRPSTVRLTVVDGRGHDEAAMAVPAQEVLAGRWADNPVDG